MTPIEALGNLVDAVHDYYENANRYYGIDMLEVLAKPLNNAMNVLSEQQRNCDVEITKVKR